MHHTTLPRLSLRSSVRPFTPQAKMNNHKLTLRLLIVFVAVAALALTLSLFPLKPTGTDTHRANSGTTPWQHPSANEETPGKTRGFSSSETLEAERGRFELPLPFGKLVFETSAFSRSATSPWGRPGLWDGCGSGWGPGCSLGRLAGDGYLRGNEGGSRGCGGKRLGRGLGWGVWGGEGERLGGGLSEGAGGTMLS